MSFQIGQKVVCVDAKRRRDSALWGDNYLIKWKIYTIREMIEWKLDIGLRLEEIQGPFCPIWEEEIAFYATRFRPLRETNIDVFTRLLETQPIEVALT